MYLNHLEIEELVSLGHMLNVDPSCINAASLDLRLGNTVFIEKNTISIDVATMQPCTTCIDYSKREKLNMLVRDIPGDGIEIQPGEFFLAHTIEHCNFPDDMAALFRIKSSMGRIGLEHLDAGWVDPGFHGSLTLEFKNVTQAHSIRLHKGDKIGQLVFLKGNAVPSDLSYRTKGNYNGHSGVAQAGFKS